MSDLFDMYDTLHKKVADAITPGQGDERSYKLILTMLMFDRLFIKYLCKKATADDLKEVIEELKKYVEDVDLFDFFYKELTGGGGNFFMDKLKAIFSAPETKDFASALPKLIMGKFEEFVQYSTENDKKELIENKHIATAKLEQISNDKQITDPHIFSTVFIPTMQEFKTMFQMTIPDDDLPEFCSTIDVGKMRQLHRELVSKSKIAQYQAYVDYIVGLDVEDAVLLCKFMGAFKS
jgi:hypothetical protein